MLKSNSSRFTISKGTFSSVGKGNQYNISNYYSETPDARPRFSPEDEWKTELYREYQRVSKGECNLLRKIGEHSVPQCYEDENFRQSSVGQFYRGPSLLTKRVFNLARCHNGQNESLLTSVVYTGPGAKTVFREDFISLSQIKHASVAQLLAFNDSESSPMMLFRDELIPMAVVLQHHIDCRAALSYYISLQDFLILSTDESIPQFLQMTWSQVWLHPQDGRIVYLPEGPEVYPEPSSFYVNSIPPTVPQQHLLSLNLYTHRHLMEYLAGCLVEDFSFLASQLQELPTQIRDLYSNHRSAVGNFASGSPRILARFPEYESGILWEPRHPSHYGDLMNDGRIRFEIAPPFYDLDFIFNHSTQVRRRPKISEFSIWLAQACCIFCKLDVSREHWDKYGLLTRVELRLIPDLTTTHGTSTLHTAGEYFSLDPPCFLFVQLPPRFCDGFPDVSKWKSSEELYYWSTDAVGSTVMSERETFERGLPRFVPQLKVSMRTWKPEEYDFVRDLQVAKRFDPYTTDFARSLGFPVVETIEDSEHRFEVVSDDSSFISSAFNSPGGDGDL